MKKLPFLLLIILFSISTINAEQSFYSPGSGFHVRIVEFDWMADETFDNATISSINNFNLSRYSYVKINFTMEFWNPNAVAVEVGNPLSEADVSSRLTVEATHEIDTRLPRAGGCFGKGLTQDDDPNDCTMYDDDFFNTVLLSPGTTRFQRQTFVRFNQSGVDDWIEGEYVFYFRTYSSIAFHLVKNSTGVFTFSDPLPENWGRILSLGYGVSLGILPFSSIFLLYGTPVILVGTFLLMLRYYRVRKLSIKKA
ncbi:MAG: hypothetical protein D6732_01900 [Methanobacteriota archaeon]|nr:MAG: hypothetical protein D6732_01900 [Euryarchaeota archaeon]